MFEWRKRINVITDVRLMLLSREKFRIEAFHSLAVKLIIQNILTLLFGFVYYKFFIFF